MKKIILGFFAILILVGIVYGYKLLHPPVIRTDEDVKKANSAVLCNWKKNSCDFYKSEVGSGNLKVAITLNGKPGKKIEVDLWTSPQPGGSEEAFVKYTDDNGVALFKGIPPGVYYPNYNLNGFPKEYGNAYMTWGTHKTQLQKGATKEIIINLVKD